MEEASVLGKRIGIISSGKMKCIGTPLFLIERFGKYLSLNLSMEEDADTQSIINFFEKTIPNNVILTIVPYIKIFNFFVIFLII
jgi:ABC-type multidrug transport system ATPase subunit